MIYGIGTDILQISRIDAILARQGTRFAQRVLGEEEMEVFLQRSVALPARGARFLATRIAAKEAFAKALGLGVRYPMTWQTLQTLNAPNGAPHLVTQGALKDFLNDRQLHAQVSLSDETEYAVAFVIIEKR